MEAARIATLRGHTVTLFEKSGELGGAILYCCTVPGKNKMRWYADWLRRQVAKLGVEVQYHARPGVEELKNFDAVILATGGTVARPDIPGIDSDLRLHLHGRAALHGMKTASSIPRTKRAADRLRRHGPDLGRPFRRGRRRREARGSRAGRSTSSPRTASSPSGWSPATAT